MEADEADGTFVRLGAQGVIVTNVEPDHLDYFGDETALASAFERFVSQAPGPRIVCGDDKTASSLASGGRGVITYGTSEGSDYQNLDRRPGRGRVDVRSARSRSQPRAVRADRPRAAQRAQCDGGSGYGR